MATAQKPDAEVLRETIRVCIANGERILDESYNLEFVNPPSSRFFLVMIAQEEFAKAFIPVQIGQVREMFSRRASP
jgi:hypothetical protein